MLRLLLALGLLSSCHDKCEDAGGYWEHFNCHPYTYWVNNCVVYDKHGNCVQHMMVPVQENRCDKRCVMPDKESNGRQTKPEREANQPAPGEASSR